MEARPGGLREERGREGHEGVDVEAGLPVTDGPPQPMGSGKMTSSLREVWNWPSGGEEVGGGRRGAGGGAVRP